MIVDKERVRLLIQALRSGRFKQGHSVLARVHDDESVSYCCLGVACRVALENGVEMEVRIRKSPGGIAKDLIFNGSGGYMPMSVKEWFGFEDTNPLLVKDDGFRDRAAVFNDELGLNLEQIADAFERTYLQPEEISA